MPRIEARVLATLSAAAVAPYLNALRCGFTFDDGGMILKNPVVHAAHIPFRALMTAPFEPGSLYRPVTFLTFWVNQTFTPGHAFGFHLVNVGLHLVATLLVYKLAVRLLSHSWSAFLCALLFAVHPIHTEAVTSIVGRSELLAAIGVLAALLSFEHAVESPNHRSGWLGLGAASFLLGLLSKESAFVCFPLLILIRGYRTRGTLPARAKAICRSPDVALVALIAFGYLGFRISMLGGLTLPVIPNWLDNPLAQTSAAVRIGTALVVLADYIGLLALPLHLSADYSFNQVPLVTSPLDPRLLVSLLSLTCLGAIAWRLRRSLPILGFGLLFFGAALCLTSNLLFPIGTIKAERLLYLPSVGFFLIAADLVPRLAPSHPKRLGAIATAILLLLAIRTWVRNEDWKSNLALFRATVAVAPHSAKANHNLGVALNLKRDYTDAALSFRRALEIYPKYAQAAFGIGRAYELRGITSGALHWYDEALRLDPDYVEAQLNLGAILYNRGDLAAAERAFRRGLELAPDNPKLLTGLGLTRLARGDGKQAAEILKRATALGSANEETQRALRLALKASARSSLTPAPLPHTRSAENAS